jgi:hypothetical protein
VVARRAGAAPGTRAHTRIRAIDRPAIDGRPCRDPAQQPGDDAQERRLAAAVRPDQGDDLPGSIARSTPSSAVSRSPRARRKRDGDVPQLDAAGRPARHAASPRMTGDHRRVEREVRLERAVVGSRRLGSGSKRRSIAVIARIAARQVGCARRRPRRRSPPDRRRLSESRHLDAKAGDVGLDLVPAASRAGPPQARMAVTSMPRRSIGGRRGEWRTPRPRGSLEPCAAGVAQGQAGERAARGRIPERRALAGKVRQEDEAFRARLDPARLGQELGDRHGSTENLAPEPVERSARRGHRAADGVETGHRRRRREPAGDLDRSIA